MHDAFGRFLGIKYGVLHSVNDDAFIGHTGTDKELHTSYI